MTQAILQTWEKALKYQFVARLERWGRLRNQVSDVVKTVAQRAYTSLSVNKEEEIRAWWRVYQEEKRMFWTRRGYSDAQHGNDGYPHHGTCYCAWCKAYWAGHVRFQHGDSQEATAYQVELSPLGFLSPPPRKEVITRAVKSLAHSKKGNVNKDIVIQSYPAMFSGSYSPFNNGSTTKKTEEMLAVSPLKTEAQCPQPQGQWELPTQKKVKSVAKKKPRKVSNIRSMKSAKTTKMTAKRKRTSSVGKRKAKPSTMPLAV